MSRIEASKVRSGKASTVKRAFWPGATPPMSASSIAAFSSMLFRSAAMTNSTGACSDEATVWPGIDRAGQHDAVDRRVDRAFFDVGLPLLQLGLGDGEVGLGDLDGAVGAVARGGRRLQRLVGDHAALRQLLLAGQRLLAFLQRGAGVVDPGGGRLGRGLSALDLRGRAAWCRARPARRPCARGRSRRPRRCAPRPTVRWKCRPGSAAAACRSPKP